MVGCANDNAPQDMRVVFPEVNGLTYSDLSSEARSQLRAEISIDGILGATPLELDPSDGSGYARLELPAGTSGTYNVKIEYFGAKIVMRTRSSYSEVSADLYHRGRGQQRCRYAMGQRR